jgi:hypothetical protein
MYVAKAPRAVIANNAIVNNSCRTGAALYLTSSSATVSNNTITNNNASGGVIVISDCVPRIVNTIVAYNSSGLLQNGSSVAVLRYNCVYGNAAYNYSGINDPTGFAGNISVDPRLAASEYGNVHIQPDSPCVDAGTNGAGAGDTDFDGDPRIDPAGGIVDIGADESDGITWSPGPYKVVRVSTIGDDANDGATWASAKRTIQAGIDAASAVGGDVWVAAGTYAERITLLPYAHLYGGFVGGETQRDQRDWNANRVVLDGLLEGPVVTMIAMGAVSTFSSAHRGLRTIASSATRRRGAVVSTWRSPIRRLRTTWSPGIAAGLAAAACT